MEVVLRTCDEAQVHTVSPSDQISSLGSNLIWAGRSLRSDLTFADYGIPSGSELIQDREDLGGKKKRKKKVYTTPKVKKHVHKKVKLAVLKYYKIDGDKVTRMRQYSPMWPATGRFLAKHDNRLYCGATNTSYAFES